MACPRSFIIATATIATMCMSVSQGCANTRLQAVKAQGEIGGPTVALADEADWLEGCLNEGRRFGPKTYVVIRVLPVYDVGILAFRESRFVLRMRRPSPEMAGEPLSLSRLIGRLTLEAPSDSMLELLDELPDSVWHLDEWYVAVESLHWRAEPSQRALWRSDYVSLMLRRNQGKTQAWLTRPPDLTPYLREAAFSRFPAQDGELLPMSEAMQPGVTVPEVADDQAAALFSSLLALNGRVSFVPEYVELRGIHGRALGCFPGRVEG